MAASADWMMVPSAIASGTIVNGPSGAYLAATAEAAILLAANIGGDSDSVASIAGAILGARYPETVNDEWYAVVERVNGHDLTALAARLSGLRC
jgi:ADP-ribosylglycohydrolase